MYAAAISQTSWWDMQHGSQVSNAVQMRQKTADAVAGGRQQTGHEAGLLQHPQAEAEAEAGQPAGAEAEAGVVQ